jgi:hypothetical protein
MFPNQKKLKDVNIGGKLIFLNVYLEEKIEDTNGQRDPPVNQKDITIQRENAKGRTDKQ